MSKTITILICFLLFQSVSAQVKSEYDTFLEEVSNGFGVSAEKLNKKYRLGDYDRWDANQNTGKLVFSSKGQPGVIASFQIAGSYSTRSGTWKWSWANETVDDTMKRDMSKIKEFGEQNKFHELTAPQWECEEEYAWTMTSVAGQLTKAIGAYRGRIPDGYVYLLIMEAEWAKKSK